ncbi:methylmalonyl-CoA mutase [Tamilnaduibacter salinus]|uniref:Fused isobutyryl-CoA mutase n=1 Tax=Tamilnaduibacter salinus TaxID=1484056 RepID=A0A2A2I094_9GAMM|nr:methylmalonyl-CoA mutase family protein [Tamilnaduibacter salinus]PAV24704.1 methylmalonyl-CoA mutase [Tamilnaduibacter salinus]PVY79096.1 methylmalonyl-CoA mutase [Tamilnaduibacter salinus]
MTDDTTPLRFITAASLFDGHDAAINIMRRLIQTKGCEVIHLGHNRSVDDIVRAALQEDADAIAISSYQGGHMEFFRYLIDRLNEEGIGHVAVFGGGGGTITPDEITALHEYGVTRLYHPNDGMKQGLVAMIDDVVSRAEARRQERRSDPRTSVAQIARTLSAIEQEHPPAEMADSDTPVIGLTGTGGAGKSSLTDELINRFLRFCPGKRLAVLAIDPTRRRTGGALLGDRIRMNSLRNDRVFFRSMATRRQHQSTSAVLADAIRYLKQSDFDLVMVETAGIGQSDSEIVDMVDHSIYVMTSDFGAASQLEKIDMLDLADTIVINKFERSGSLDALRDVRKQWKRNHNRFDVNNEQIPVFATNASQFNDEGVSGLFSHLSDWLTWEASTAFPWALPDTAPLIASERDRYLAEIAEDNRANAQTIEAMADTARDAQTAWNALKALDDPDLPEALAPYSDTTHENDAIRQLRDRYNQALERLDPELLNALRQWPEKKASVEGERYQYQVRDKVFEGDNYRYSLSELAVPKVATPGYRDWGDLLTFLGNENLPGHYPYTAGVFPYRREGEDPTRMFAGEGTPERTNRRFHYLASGQPAARLSTAFDSVTLYGENPDRRPDIYGKVGNSGVSIATVDDMKRLYSGFDLCDPTTSVSMTINGPAPTILAFFMNAAIDQQVEKHLQETGQWEQVQRQLADRDRPTYDAELPPGHNGLGLGLLGVNGDEVVDADTYARIREETLQRVRGTVQADILKEDQAQNTCIFSTEFAMHMLGDIQQYFVDHGVRNFYSVSISGYHIAEAGANPITQLAFTLANGFTLVEYYLSRGMAIDDFAPSLSFFFSNGMDPEYAVIGRVARRIWARAMKNRYGASERSQKLKYHIQTSGRSLHAQEMQFNDIRTTLQALYALLDNCNSLHTNAFDEAITTPTEDSVRRAVAIQLIINRELGLNACENPWQGSFIIERLTDQVEEAVLQEFERLNDRGGVLAAMDTMYQRGKIQEESMVYEHRKHDGSLPIIGVNTYLPKDGEQATEEPELMRSDDDEKHQRIAQLRAFQGQHQDERAGHLSRLQQVAAERGNTFDALMEAVKHCSLGEISHVLYETGGEYRRNM